MADDKTGYGIPIGTVEDARSLIGVKTPMRSGEFDVNWAMIKHFCAMTQDGNPSYWDEEFAKEQWGAVISPPAMAMIWLMPLEWKPDQPAPIPLLTLRVPLPGDTFVNASNDAEFFEPIRVGDHLSVVEEVEAVSDERTTALGTGHFLTILTTYSRQDGVVVAKLHNTLFRYSKAEDGA